MRKIILTENQIKRVINKVINEQQVLSKTTETKPSKVYNISNSFASGQYKLSNTKDIIGAMESINKEIEGYGENTQFVITIESSESTVPPPAGMKVGDLSRLRGEAVKSFLENGNYVPKDANVNFKNLDKGVQGPAWDTTKGKDWSEYKKNQYVTLSLQIIGSKTVETICNFSQNMSGGVAKKENNFVGYTKTIDISKLPNGTKLKISLTPYSAADMLVVKMGEVSKSTGFISNNPESSVVRATLATALYYGYGGKVPSYMPSGFVELNREEKEAIFKNLEMDGLKSYWGHVMNPQVFTWSKNIFLNSVKMYSFTDSSSINLVSDDQTSSSIEIVKNQNTPSITMSVYSPVGGTVWKLDAQCL
jgi:hypothetical protein